MKKNKKWYSIRTFYLTKAVGTPVHKDRIFKKKSVLLEERTVLVTARSLKEAVRKAEADARAYAKDRHSNVYDQDVHTKYVNLWDSWELYESPGNLEEVFYISEILDSEPSRDAIWKRKIGRERGRNEDTLRLKFLNKEFNMGTYSQIRKKK